MKDRTLSFRVTLRVPADRTAADMKEFIREAIETWPQQYHPLDSLFQLYMRHPIKIASIRNWRRP